MRERRRERCVKTTPGRQPPPIRPPGVPRCIPSAEPLSALIGPVASTPASLSHTPKRTSEAHTWRTSVAASALYASAEREGRNLLHLICQTNKLSTTA